MRRTATEQVSVDEHTDDLYYDLVVSPRTSVYSTSTAPSIKHASSPVPTPPTPAPTTPQPSIRLLFSLLSRRHLLCLLLPAVVSSMIAGGVAPFMTFVVGQAFDAFARFPLSDPTQSDKDTLLRSVGLVAIQLLALAFGSLALGSVTSGLWIWTGERNAMVLRKAAYRSVGKKNMVWFDNHLGDQDAGGLMAKFARETDDVRMATSLASGYLVQYLTTTIACLLLAFLRSWSLTLVILSAVPLLTFIQAFSQAIANPLLFHERSLTSHSASIISRCLSSIATVKAFTAQALELSLANAAFDQLRGAAKRLNKVWGITSAMAHFVMMGMFVQGFWFGSKLVREGKVSAGDVMATFWACLIATSNLQMCIPQFITLAKGKFAMVALMEMIDDNSSSSSSSPSASHVPTTPLPITPSSTKSRFSTATATSYSAASLHKHHHRPHLSRSHTLKKITPSKCHGEFALHNVTFSYPSKPDTPVLQNVSIYLPAHETTFIVGSSGSGKSTIAALLMRMYDPQEGVVMLDDQDVRFLDEKWVRGHIGGVSQGFGGVVILEGKSVWENVAVGIYGRIGGGGLRGMKEVTEGEVEEACRMAMVHEFVKDLSEGYETVLGGSGNGDEGGEDNGKCGIMLSGGQRQRLALARARIRDPAILILDEATSALDATSRILVFEAIKMWRRNKTTIVITHDLSQIRGEDFVYVLKGGKVVEQGYRTDLEAETSSLSHSPTPSSSQSDLNSEDDNGRGEFKKMMESQRQMGGYLPEKDIDADEPLPEYTEEDGGDEEDGFIRVMDYDEARANSRLEARLSLTSMRPLTFGNWMFDVVADLTSQFGNANTNHTNNNSFNRSNSYSNSNNTVKERRRSKFVPRLQAATEFPTLEEDEEEGQVQFASRVRKSSSVLLTPTVPKLAMTNLDVGLDRRWSLQWTPVSPTTTLFSQSQNFSQVFGSSGQGGVAKKIEEEEEDEEETKFVEQKECVKGAGIAAAAIREKCQTRRSGKIDIRVDSTPTLQQSSSEHEEELPKFWKLVGTIWPLIPNKSLLLFGLLVCLLSGSVTPIFSFLLSRLLFEVSIGASNASIINKFGGIVLSIAAIDGILLGLKYYIMETAGMLWVTKLRTMAYTKVINQDKTWFDKDDSRVTRLIQWLIKDGDDARDLISVVLGQCFVVVAMLFIGLVWALVRGWELTLVGLAYAPVFAGIMAVQTKLVAKCELRNKRAREEVSKGWYEMISNVKGIRAMGINQPFDDAFEKSTEKALKTGVRGAWVEGCTYGVATGLIYVAEAVLFYVGAVMIGNGRYSYLQMLEVLNLVVFSVTIGSQLMAFTEKIAKSIQATHDLVKLTQLDDRSTTESKGLLKPHPSMFSSGTLSFQNVSFAYPTTSTSTPSASIPFATSTSKISSQSLVLNHFNLTIHPGESVALVGSSGCGKSTITSLLQRLYEPTEGRIRLGDLDICDVHVDALRKQMGVVSQNAEVFEERSVDENVLYGINTSEVFDSEDERREVVSWACEVANVCEFVKPPATDGDETGENAYAYGNVLGELSGGQKQRVQIARALARVAIAALQTQGKGSGILILDECTSALDGENQYRIMQAISDLKNDSYDVDVDPIDGEIRTYGLKVLVVTHKIEVMRMCDRVVVVKDGRVVEEGAYGDLIERRGGFFRELARGGEWEA